MSAIFQPLTVEKLTSLAQIVPLSVPMGLTISTCNFCDFRCIYCGQDKTKPVPALLTMERFEEIARQLSAFEKPIKQVSFVASGETILNDRLPDMIRILKEHRLAESVKIITNANRLTRAYTDRLLDAGLDIIKISLQGLTAKKYKDICGVEIDYERFVEQIRYFYNRRGTCKVHIKIIDIALEPGEEEQFYQVYRDISDVIFIEKCVGELAEKQEEFTNKFGMDTFAAKVCPMPFYTFFIDELGNVFPCCLTNRKIHGTDHIIGNIHETTIKQLWDREFRSLQKALLTGLTDVESLCHKCTQYKNYIRQADVLDGDISQILKKF